MAYCFMAPEEPTVCSTKACVTTAPAELSVQVLLHDAYRWLHEAVMAVVAVNVKRYKQEALLDLSCNDKNT